MRLFKEVPISSAKQAEKLPAGTIYHRAPVDESDGGATGHDTGFGIRAADDYGSYFISSRQLIEDHWTALVPVEAEEETKSADHYRGPVVVRTQRTLTRLVTPWEPS